MSKRLGALALAFIMLFGTMGAALAAPGVEADVTLSATNDFDPETVMWTDNPVENVLAEAGVYSNAADVNPNAAKDTTSVQNPYAGSGTNYNGWEYAEFCWTNSYPIGNGRMAGMVAGGIDKEVIQINEDTCWDGSPYGTLKNEKDETITTIGQTSKAETISVVDQTSGSIPESWRYYRGADVNDESVPAEVGAANVLVGDQVFRDAYPQFANKSLANQSLNVDNSKTLDAVQDRWSMERMVEATFLGKPVRQRAYKSFAEVYLDFGQEHQKATNYTKSLDMKTGIVTVEYDYDGSHFKRDSFASYPDQVVVTHVESSSDLNFSAELHTYHDNASYVKYEKISDNEVKVKSAIQNGNKDNDGPGTVNAIQFEARMLLSGDGAFSVSEDNTTVSVVGGRSADIYVVGATNYVDYLNLDNSKQGRDCDTYSANVKSRTYDQIKERHIEDFAPLFARTELNIDNANGVDYSDTPTEKRVREDIKGESGFLTGSGSKLTDANKAGVYSTYTRGDNQLAALEFNYGKYLLIAGSRDGKPASGGDIEIPESQPLNLTGKWNAALSASWSGKYTININTEMNYWAAQPLNIADCEKPLIDTFKELAQGGAITAANQYAVYNERGDDNYEPGDPWVMHHNYDLWRGTQPIDNATAGLWPTGGAWLLDHAWQYYEFNKDTEYLAEVYPYMVGAAKFFTEMLVIDPVTGYLVTAASCSPEQGGVQPGPAMDTQLVRNLYYMVQESSEILGKTGENATLLAKIDEQMPSTYLADEQGKIAPNLIDNSGLIEEWARGDVSFDISKRDTGQWNVTNPFTGEKTQVYDHAASNNNGHRHCSHLYELYPGTHVGGYSDDENEQKIFKAYQKSTAARGAGSGQGWGLAWRIALNARSFDGNSASSILEQLFTTRTSPNLFDQHPNFQIDGNYGATAGILEMLVQSHDGTINLLPAVPDKWKSGSFKGFKTREDALVDLVWQDNKPYEAKIYPTSTKDISIRSKYVADALVYDRNGNEVETIKNEEGNLMTFAVVDGEEYTINRFGREISEITTVYPASEATGFFASDGKETPKVDGNGIEVGYLYNRSGVQIGYVVKNVACDNVKSMNLKMARVRDSNVYLTVNVGSRTGTEIAKQIVTTGDNELDLKNIAEISGTKDLYLSFTQDPYSDAQKYLGNSSDLIVVTGSSGSNPTEPPTPTIEPSDDYIYTINSASFAQDGKLNVDVEYIDQGDSVDAKLLVASYDSIDSGIMTDSAIFDINGTENLALDYQKPENGTVKLYIWDGTDTLNPLSGAYTVGDNPAPTLAPTSGPTAEPTSTPDVTAKPTAEPTTPPATGTPAPTTNPDKTYTVDQNQETNADVRIFKTVREAVAAVEANAPTSEDMRAYINIVPGVYREQVHVNKPYITMQKQPGAEGEAKLTWYYGTNTKYDSCNASGYYDPSVIDGGATKNAPKDWGATLNVRGGATGFVLENIYLENSFNEYYTQEELGEFMEPEEGIDRAGWLNTQIGAGKSDAEINQWIQSRSPVSSEKDAPSLRERACALKSGADKVVIKNCTVMGKQDTIGIDNARIYFEKCKLGGTVDYICGSATAVMNSCELYWNAGPIMDTSKSTDTDSGHVTAPAQASAKGYVFYNCKITGSDTATAGTLGRPWNANGEAKYINTVIGKSTRSGFAGNSLVTNAGWASMSGPPEEARFGEYGSIHDDGTSVNTSDKLRTKLLLNEWSMLTYNPYNFMLGTDGWDPAGLSETYANVNNVIDTTTIDTSNSETNIVDLPQPPSGYEFSWESNSEYAIVNAEKTKINVIRPAYGETPIDATVNLYVREKDNREIGAEKSIAFQIQPTSDNVNVFSVGGTVSLSVVASSDQVITIQFKSGDAVIKTHTVTVPSGQISQTYTAENLPVGSYIAYLSTSNAEYNVIPVSVDISGAKGENKTLDLQAKKMSEIRVSSPDFSANGYTPSVTSATGFSAGKYTVTGSESANLGESGNIVYKLTKDDGNKVAKNVGVSFDVKSMLDGGSLGNTKTIQFSYDMLMETIDYLPSNYSYFDLATSKSNGGNDAADQTRFVRMGVMKNWKQLNLFPAPNQRINGDKTQFDQNNTMANKWYRIVTDIDLDNQTIVTTIYDRDWKTGDPGTYMLNGKPFSVAKPEEDSGENPNYPTNIDLSSLFFNIYMDRNADTTTKLEYYVDNIEVVYQDFE